jgi:hypothetical protein
MPFPCYINNNYFGKRIMAHAASIAISEYCAFNYVEQPLDFTLNVVLSRGDSYRLGILHLGVCIQTVSGHLASQGAG